MFISHTCLAFLRARTEFSSSVRSIWELERGEPVDRTTLFSRAKKDRRRSRGVEASSLANLNPSIQSEAGEGEAWDTWLVELPGVLWIEQGF